MNHYVSTIIVSLCIAAVFTFIARDEPRAQLFYFLKLMAYMVLGPLAAAWIMYFIPW